jgi:putative membrane protein
VNISDLSTVNAILNGLSAIFLILGFIFIKRRNVQFHRASILTAFTLSVLFFISYLFYHHHAGSVPYAHHDWTRPLYFTILISHIILAVVMIPLILMSLWYALKERFEQHKRLVKWTWPIWIYVSLSGLIIYLMLYHR